MLTFQEVYNDYKNVLDESFKHLNNISTNKIKEEGVIKIDIVSKIVNHIKYYFDADSIREIPIDFFAKDNKIEYFFNNGRTEDELGIIFETEYRNGIAFIKNFFLNGYNNIYEFEYLSKGVLIRTFELQRICEIFSKVIEIDTTCYGDIVDNPEIGEDFIKKLEIEKYLNEESLRYYQNIKEEYAEYLDESYRHLESNSIEDVKNDYKPEYKVGDLFPSAEHPEGIVVFEKNEEIEVQLKGMVKTDLTILDPFDYSIKDLKYIQQQNINTSNKVKFGEWYLPTDEECFELYRNDERAQKILNTLIKITNSKLDFTDNCMIWKSFKNDFPIIYNTRNNHWEWLVSKERQEAICAVLMKLKKIY